MKRLKFLAYFLVSVSFCWGSARAAAPILWMQQPAISPDGRWIAFEYKGNIYKVPSEGGNAVALTANSYYNGYPKWSKDGSQIAFASDRYSNFDVFIMPSSGGTSARLTYASTSDIPADFSNDGKLVYYITQAHDVYTSARFSDDDGLWLKLFSVPATGGRTHLVNSAGTEFASFNQSGDKLIFQDKKGYENNYRKHHISPVTRDIWCYDIRTNNYTQLSAFKGEDREPVWGRDGKFFYLSERAGNQNLFSATLKEPGKVTQLTNFDKNPVRNLSISKDETLAFTQNGELYTLSAGGTSRKVEIFLTADFDDNHIKNVSFQDIGDDAAVSPDGKEIAFIHAGDVFVSPAAGGIARQLTKTPQQERMVSFSPDGRTLLYSVENGSSWDIYKAQTGTKDNNFYGAIEVKFQPLIATSGDEFQGVFSPDGTKIAYLRDRTILSVYDLTTKKSVALNASSDNYSAQDGDLIFGWSPDSKYLTLQAGNNLVARLDIDLVKADGSGKPVNLTKGASASFSPRWSADGKMIYYLSGKEGSGGQRDVFGLFLDRSAFLHFGKNTPQTKTDSAVTFSPDLIHLEDRELKLTGITAPLSDAVLSPDGQKLYSLSAFGNIQGIYVTDQQSHEETLFTKLPQAAGKLSISSDGKCLYLLSGGKLSKISTADGSVTAVAISGSQQLNIAEQRAYILAHLYHLFGKKFYDPKLGGVDWTYYYGQYKRFLEHINNNYDFEMLLSEFVGELNSSHSGAGYRPHLQGGDETASLGLLYDLTTVGKGLRVKAILSGGPFDLTETHLKPGDLIDRIDGNEITETADWVQFLNHKPGKQIAVSYHQPENSKEFTDMITPVSLTEETDLLYKRWVHLMEHLTDSLSNGQIAYVHIREMSRECLRATYEGAAGRGLGKKAVIVDTRYNTGGNIHEDLMAMITGSDALLYDRPQGASQIDEGNSSALNKPTCVIVSEGNYSDGFNFPYLYQLRKSGKLIGMPVAGTGTGPWYETQVDPTLFAGVPEIGLSLPGEHQPLLENHQLDPDIMVRNDYQQLLKGRDQQLEAAVSELLKEIKK